MVSSDLEFKVRRERCGGCVVVVDTTESSQQFSSARFVFGIDSVPPSTTNLGRKNAINDASNLSNDPNYTTNPVGRNKKVDGRPNPKIAFCSARGGLRETLRFFATCEVGKQNFSIDTHSLEPNWVTRRCPARINLSAQFIPICKFVAGEDFSSGSHGVSIPDTPCFPVTHLRSRSG